MGDPRQMWENMQKTLQRAQKTGQKYAQSNTRSLMRYIWSCILTEMSCRFGGGAGGPGGNPKAALGGMGLLILDTGALWTFNNALFNGTKRAWLYEMV